MSTRCAPTSAGRSAASACSTTCVDAARPTSRQTASRLRSRRQPDPDSSFTSESLYPTRRPHGPDSQAHQDDARRFTRRVRHLPHRNHRVSRVVARLRRADDRQPLTASTASPGKPEMTAQLEAMESIRQRKAKYCRYLDTRQFDAWEALFTPDAKIVFYKPDKSVIARFDSIADMSRMTRDLFATNRTAHQTH